MMNMAHSVMTASLLNPATASAGVTRPVTVTAPTTSSATMSMRSASVTNSTSAITRIVMTSAMSNIRRVLRCAVTAASGRFDCEQVAGRTRVLSRAVSSVTPPSERRTRARPGAPSPPPASPNGAIRRRFERMASSIGSRNSMRRTAPSPPARRPLPPLPLRRLNSRSNTGNRNSRTSGSVRRELVMWVCTADAPWKSRPAPLPPQTVS